MQNNESIWLSCKLVFLLFYFRINLSKYPIKRVGTIMFNILSKKEKIFRLEHFYSHNESFIKR